MRIYFSANIDADQKYQLRFSAIITALHGIGVSVMSNLLETNLAAFTKQDIDRISSAGEGLLEKMDGLIIEGSSPYSENPYLVALALAHGKPILYLQERGKAIDQNLQRLKRDKKSSALLTLAEYTEENLNDLVRQFASRLEQGETAEAPTIKFTLRITPRIERYLQWKTLNTKLTKADFLRDLLDELIEEDGEFKKFLQREPKA